MVPETPTPTQAQNPPDPGPTPDRCPWCGRPLFSLPVSGLLDYLALAEDVLHDLRTALEDAVLP